MRLMPLIFVCMLTGVVFPGASRAHAASQDPLAAVFARMDQAAARFKDMTADMKKVSYMAVLKEETVDIGKIAVKVPKRHEYRMLINFTQPDEKQVQLWGTKVDVYYPKTKIDQDMDLGKTNRAMIETFVLLGFGSNSKDLQDAYTVKYGGPETVAGQKTTRIELVPKNPEVASQFPKFELWISDETGISVQQKMYQRGGDYSLATYTNMKINQNLPDSAVKLNLPRGVERQHIQR
jgi:outer membrane lipoprotein-sorting protein